MRSLFFFTYTQMILLSYSEHVHIWCCHGDIRIVLFSRPYCERKLLMCTSGELYAALQIGLYCLQVLRLENECQYYHHLLIGCYLYSPWQTKNKSNQSFYRMWLDLKKYSKMEFLKEKKMYVLFEGSDGVYRYIIKDKKYRKKGQKIKECIQSGCCFFDTFPVFILNFNVK